MADAFDDMPVDDGEILQTQEVGSQSQGQRVATDHLWGYLQPCRNEMARIELIKVNPTIRIGRREGNDFVLPGFKVSNNHCVIRWDGIESNDSVIVITDLSSNGTFVNGRKLGKGQSAALRDGADVAFGTCQPQQNRAEDYRFIFRNCIIGEPLTGIRRAYDMGTELGKGSFASVFKAIERETGKCYAVKVIHRNKIGQNSTNMQETFNREINILEGLEHQYICRMKEVFWEEERINLVLELVEGGDLLEYIITRNGLAEPDAMHITYQLCTALAYIHSRGIAHRDLKPENVLLTKDDPPVVKVADFGLAKVVDSATRLRTMCGTPSYLAPEVVLQENHSGYSHLVDSWSVGVIVFSALTNMGPFIEDEALDMRTRIKTRTIDWDTLNQTNISSEAKHFIARLLDPDPATRMSLTDALKHPWMQAYATYHAALAPSYDMHSPSPPPVSQADTSMLSNVSVGDMSDVENSQPAQNGNGTNLKRQGSGLHRRSDVVLAAEEGEGRLPSPSEEMVASQDPARENGDAAAATAGPGPSTRANKRKLQTALSGIPEDGGLRPSNGGAAKRGKTSSESDEMPVSPAKTRATAKKAPRTRAAAKGAAANSDSDEAPSPRPRRSTRQTPQKRA